MDDSVFLFKEVECIGNTQIIHMEETRITQRTIGLVLSIVTEKSPISPIDIECTQYGQNSLRYRLQLRHYLKKLSILSSIRQ